MHPDLDIEFDRVRDTWDGFNDIPPDPPSPPQPPRDDDRGHGGAGVRSRRRPKHPPQRGGAQAKVERESELVCI